MTKSTSDLNSNSEREDSEKNMIAKENIQFIEQIGEGKFNTGKETLCVNRGNFGFDFFSF
jgi:hypothetical protein